MNLDTFFNQWPPAHHAYGISSLHTTISDVKKHIETKNVSYVYNRFYDAFGIDDARMIKNLQSEKTDDACVFIISFSVINIQAQNALLKVLEEPTENTYFFLLYPNFKQLLPTLQSRLEVLEMKPEERDQQGKHAETFVALSLAERFTWIKEHTDAKAGDAKLTKEDTKQLLYDLERYYTAHKSKESSAVVNVLYEAQRCINANGASLKMILDMVAVHIGQDTLATNQ